MKKKLLIFFLINLFNLNITKSMNNSENKKNQQEIKSTNPVVEASTQKNQPEKEQPKKEEKKAETQKNQPEKEQPKKEEKKADKEDKKVKSNLKQEAEKSMLEIPNLLKKIEVYIEDLPAKEKLTLKELILNINKIKDELKNNLIKLAANLNSDHSTILALTS
jgi:hypothetical protein